MPWLFLKANQYIVRNTSYGTTNFKFEATYKDYGMVFLIMLGVGIACGLPIWLINAFVPAVSIVGTLLLIALYFFMIVYFMVSMNTLFYNNLSIADHSFETNINMVDLSKVILINIGLIIVTLGLYLPAARVRMTKYLCQHNRLECRRFAG
ncbi:MAG: DUF898 family protein [Marinagarivorans sp.]|nr:DUF898 family protein [Marinagarivorans sp.]